MNFYKLSSVKQSIYLFIKHIQSGIGTNDELFNLTIGFTFYLYVSKEYKNLIDENNNMIMFLITISGIRKKKYYICNKLYFTLIGIIKFN